MPRNLTGNVHESRGRWYARMTIVKGARSTLPLPLCSTEHQAEARLAVLADFAARLRTAGVPPGSIKTFLEAAGAAAEGKALDKVCNTVDVVCKGDARRMPDSSKSTTFQDVG